MPTERDWQSRMSNLRSHFRSTFIISTQSRMSTMMIRSMLYHRISKILFSKVKRQFTGTIMPLKRKRFWLLKALTINPTLTTDTESETFSQTSISQHSRVMAKISTYQISISRQWEIQWMLQFQEKRLFRQLQSITSSKLANLTFLSRASIKLMSMTNHLDQILRIVWWLWIASIYTRAILITIGRFSHSQFMAKA